MKSVTKEVIKRPMMELLEELKAKVVLLEGDRRAYYESSYITMQQNRETIGTLRKELYDLRKCLWDRTHSDFTVVSQAFQNRPVDKAAFSKMSSRHAIDEMDFRVSGSMKRFNLVHFATQQKRQRVEALVSEYRVCEMEHGTAFADLPQMQSLLQQIRDMENRCDKLMLKNHECEFIQQTYDAIYTRLYNEETRANSVLDEMESDIRRCRAENADLVAIHRDATEGKEATTEELRRLEEFVYADRKRRDIEVLRMRRVSEEHRMENERTEKKGDEQNGEQKLDSQTTDNLTQSFSTSSSETFDHEFEDNYRRLKDVTGIPNVRDIVEKFEHQMHTKHDLIALINKMESHVNERRALRAERGERLEELKARVDRSAMDVHVQTKEKRSEVEMKSEEIEKLTEELTEVSQFVSAAKFGVEHLMEKLVHVKLKDKPAEGTSAKPLTAEEYVRTLFRRLYEKVRQLLSDMAAYDVNGFLAKMNTEKNLLLIPQTELEGSLKTQVPHFNDRIPHENYKDVNDDDESGEDSVEWKPREMMKAMSFEFIEAKTRKSKGRRKKKVENKK